MRGLQNGLGKGDGGVDPVAPQPDVAVAARKLARARSRTSRRIAVPPAAPLPAPPASRATPAGHGARAVRCRAPRLRCARAWPNSSSAASSSSRLRSDAASRSSGADQPRRAHDRVRAPRRAARRPSAASRPRSHRLRRGRPSARGHAHKPRQETLPPARAARPFATGPASRRAASAFGRGHRRRPARLMLPRRRRPVRARVRPARGRARRGLRARAASAAARPSRAPERCAGEAEIGGVEQMMALVEHIAQVPLGPHVVGFFGAQPSCIACAITSAWLAITIGAYWRAAPRAR